MRHILLILDYFHPYIGGIETLFDDVTQFCSDKWMKITILTSRHHPSLKKIEKRGDVTIYRVGTNRLTLLPGVLWLAINKRELMKSVDHIHTSTFASALPAWIIGKIRKKPVTITIHEIYDTLRYHLKGRWGRFYVWFESLVCHLSWKKIITVSQASKKFLETTYPHLANNKIEVMLNQIDTGFRNNSQVDSDEQEEKNTRYGFSKDDTVLVFIGRLGYEKWLPYLLEAFSRLRELDTTAKLLIIAPRTKKKYKTSLQKDIDTTRQQIKNNYLSSSIVWIDPVKTDEELRTLMSIANIGIVPSMSEWFCYTAVQMQAMGLSLIASKVWALPEVLHADTTTFVSYGKVQELTDALLHTISLYREKQKVPENNARIDYTEYYTLFLDQ